MARQIHLHRFEARALLSCSRGGRLLTPFCLTELVFIFISGNMPPVSAWLSGRKAVAAVCSSVRLSVEAYIYLRKAVVSLFLV